MTPDAASAAALCRAYAAGEADPVAVAERCLDRARSADAEAVFTLVTEARARKEAQASAARYREGRPLGPLDGVPITWKDLFDLQGTVTTAASATRRGHPAADRDAPAVARLAAAGAVCIGKTNLSELAYSGLGLNVAYGTPLHPSAPDRSRVPGGSSSGAAVSVAIGAAVCGMGTDTSGSIRVPAALSGVVGYKPTAERFDRGGLQAVSPTLDSIGPLTRSVADAIVVDAVLRGAPPIAPATGPPPLLVAPLGELTEDLDAPTAAAFAATVERLQAAGWTVQRRELPALDAALAAMDRHGTLVAAEAAWSYRDLLGTPRIELLEPRIRRRLELGAAMAVTDYVALLRLRDPLRAQLRAELDGAVALFPTVRVQAPPREPLELDDERYATVNLRVLRSTMVTSYLGMPGVALPTGADGDGVPTSVLATAPDGEDDRLLAAALRLEAALAPAGERSGGAVAPAA